MFSLTKGNIQAGILRQKNNNNNNKMLPLYVLLSILFTGKGEDTDNQLFWYVGSFSQNAFVDGITRGVECFLNKVYCFLKPAESQVEQLFRVCNKPIDKLNLIRVVLMCRILENGVMHRNPCKFSHRYLGSLAFQVFPSIILGLKGQISRVTELDC